MAKNDNLKDFLTDLASAIREKEGSASLINPQDFAKRIRAISGEGGGGEVEPSRPTYTGHADAEGLRAIGWTDEDIAYYQENGVNWNEEDDEYHKVSEDNKALYGVLTADNISTYKNRIVYLPKIDTSAKTSTANMFSSCYALVAIPYLNTQNVTSMLGMFQICYSLVSVPPMNTQKVTTMNNMFYYCYSLTSVPSMDTQNVTSMSSMFAFCSSLISVPPMNTQKVTTMNSMFSTCYSLTSVPPMDTQNVTSMNYMFQTCYSLTSVPPMNTQKVTTMNSMFHNCYSLTFVPSMDTQNVTNMNSMFHNCYSLTTAYIKNIKLSLGLGNSTNLTKDSLLYIINNEAATSAITITLASYAYTRLANDADIVAALANHPNISLASA